MLGLEQLTGAALELGRSGTARQPAGADRLGGGCDLLVADGWGLEGEERIAPRRERPHLR